MSKWQIDPQEYLNRLGLDREDFQERLKLPRIKGMEKIVPLREMKHVSSLVPIDSEMLTYLIRRIPTLDGQMPFKNSEISQVVTNTRQLKIGQKYVYRENYTGLMEHGVSVLFENFLGEWSGLGNLLAYFVFGLDGSGNYSMACYIPPIIEVHDARSLIMDGIHRNYIVRSSGISMMNALLVENVEVPFPCSVNSWKAIQVIPLAEKPKALEERYFDLNKGLFRDLKYLGIDG